MASVGNVQQIIAVIRQRFEGHGRRQARAGPLGALRRNAHEARPDVFTLVGQRVKAIDPDDPQRGKAFRVFLESVLIAELDESLINDRSSAWSTTQRQMDADPQVAASIDAACHLAKTGDGP